MRSILRGKTKTHLSAKAKRIIAIVAILALLLASCAIIYREKIGELTVRFFDRDDIITHEGSKDKPQTIEEVYEFTYIPEGYVLENTLFLPNIFQYTYYDADRTEIIFEQRTLGVAITHLDSEHGESEIIMIDNIRIYRRRSAQTHTYIWDDGKYTLTIKSKFQISTEELRQIIEGIKIK